MAMEINSHEALKSLQKDGYYVVRNYWDPLQCEIAVKEIKSLPKFLFEKGQGGDIRYQHSNKNLPSAHYFLKDPLIQEIANIYSSCNKPNRVVAGVVEYKEGQEIDSGAGWHVDSEKDFQFKSFMYLTDVDTNTGPFMIVKKSKEYVKDVPKFSNLRIEENDVNLYCSFEDIVEVHGQAGTLILADSTYIHRGKKINSGSRYTYTTYFYEQ
jgi:hypothetical protein